jgi:hypothetical protein
MKRRHAAVWAGWVVGVMLVGCGSDTTQLAAPDEALHSKGICESAMAEIGPAGGTLSVGPYALYVPPGALTASTFLTMEQETCGEWPVALGPEGTLFVVPALLEFNASSEPDPGSMKVAWWNPSSQQWVEQTTYYKGAVVGTPISHFSRWIIQ